MNFMHISEGRIGAKDGQTEKKVFADHPKFNAKEKRRKFRND